MYLRLKQMKKEKELQNPTHKIKNVIRPRKNLKEQLAKGITTKSTNRDKRRPILALYWLIMV